MKNNDKILALKKIALFSSLTAEELHRIQEKVIIKNFKKNENILHAEYTSEYMYMILDGEVDEYPESAFNLVGTIEDAIEKGKRLIAESK